MQEAAISPSSAHVADAVPIANGHTFLRNEVQTLDTRIAEHSAELRLLDG